MVATKNFSLETDPKLACSCGCGLLPQQDALERLQRVRDRVGFPLRISSGARCPEYNAKVSSTGRTGPHTTGRAFDVAVSGAQAVAFVHAAIEEGFTGIGVQQKGGGRFIHVDELAPRMWSY